VFESQTHTLTHIHRHAQEFHVTSKRTKCYAPTCDSFKVLVGLFNLLNIFNWCSVHHISELAVREPVGEAVLKFTVYSRQTL